MSSPSLRVLKKETPVVIYTATHRIEGTYHANEGVRLLDDINGRTSKQFFPLTEVKIASLANEERVVFESDFVVVNIKDIVVFGPDPKKLR